MSVTHSCMGNYSLLLSEIFKKKKKNPSSYCLCIENIKLLFTDTLCVLGSCRETLLCFAKSDPSCQLIGKFEVCVVFYLGYLNVNLAAHSCTEVLYCSACVTASS